MKKNGPKLAFTDLSDISTNKPSSSSSSPSLSSHTPQPIIHKTRSRTTIATVDDIQDRVPTEIYPTRPSHIPLSSAEIQEQLTAIGVVLARKRKQYLRLCILQFIVGIPLFIVGFDLDLWITCAHFFIAFQGFSATWNRNQHLLTLTVVLTNMMLVGDAIILFFAYFWWSGGILSIFTIVFLVGMLILMIMGAAVLLILRGLLKEAQKLREPPTVVGTNAQELLAFLEDGERRRIALAPVSHPLNDHTSNMFLQGYPVNRDGRRIPMAAPRTPPETPPDSYYHTPQHTPPPMSPHSPHSHSGSSLLRSNVTSSPPGSPPTYHVQRSNSHNFLSSSTGYYFPTPIPPPDQNSKNISNYYNAANEHAYTLPPVYSPPRALFELKQFEENNSNDDTTASNSTTNAASTDTIITIPTKNNSDNSSSSDQSNNNINNHNNHNQNSNTNNNDNNDDKFTIYRHSKRVDNYSNDNMANNSTSLSRSPSNALNNNALNLNQSLNNTTNSLHSTSSNSLHTTSSSNLSSTDSTNSLLHSKSSVFNNSSTMLLSSSFEDIRNNTFNNNNDEHDSNEEQYNTINMLSEPIEEKEDPYRASTVMPIVRTKTLRDDDEFHH